MLPVLEIERQLVNHLAAANRLVLTAPTGSGKTTQAPQIAFRHQLVAADKQIIVLQPRRLATRMVAARVAVEMKTELGGLVGFQTRHESNISAQTRIRFITEGLLLRLLQSDPELRDVGMVILDEFHERNLAADMSLGLLKRLQEKSRTDLKLMVMSATLDADAVSSYLNCQTIRAGGQLFPVDVQYLPKPTLQPIWDSAAAALREIVQRGQDGDVLIFMPGVYEIHRTIDACRTAGSFSIFPLHGSLTPQEQDAALARSSNRKVVVATNVAETSITIEGIRYVIDSGVAKIHRYEIRRAINVLRSEPISRASADQRAGRAGRLGPGECIRLWTQRDHASRAAQDIPEVLRLELSEAVLQLKSMGVQDVAAFPWLQSPSQETLQQADSLLKALGAISSDGLITPRGKLMSKFPVHPRLSAMLIESIRRGCAERAALWAALINERDIFSKPQLNILLRFQPPDEPESDLLAREIAFADMKVAKFSLRRCDDLGINAAACRDVQRTAAQLSQICRRIHTRLHTPTSLQPGTTENLLRSLLVGFFDHVAMKLDDQRQNCTMVGRKKVLLDRESVVRGAGLLIALDVSEIGQGDHLQSLLSLANRIEPAWLKRETADEINTIWNDESHAVEQVHVKTYRGLEIARKIRPHVDPNAAAEILVAQIMQGNLKLEHWDEHVHQWITRTRFVSKLFPERGLISYNEEDVQVILHEIVAGATRFNQIKDRQCMQAVREALSWHDQQFVEHMAPESLPLPNGKRMRIEYQQDGPPRGCAKIQELYGLKETPRIAGGRQEILLEILGPNYRPVQITSDLGNFWQTLYPELKKELKRRYPRHEWR